MPLVFPVISLVKVLPDWTYCLLKNCFFAYVSLCETFLEHASLKLCRMFAAALNYYCAIELSLHFVQIKYFPVCSFQTQHHFSARWHSVNGFSIWNICSMTQQLAQRAGHNDKSFQCSLLASVPQQGGGKWAGFVVCWFEWRNALSVEQNNNCIWSFNAIPWPCATLAHICLNDQTTHQVFRSSEIKVSHSEFSQSEPAQTPEVTGLLRLSTTAFNRCLPVGCVVWSYSYSHKCLAKTWDRHHFYPLI